MFAIFEDGSHQHQVQVGETLTVDYRESANAGDAITFERVLLANDGETNSIGQPTIESAAVETEVVEQVKGKKLEIVKFRRRKNSKTHTGHRQKYTSVRVTGITVPGMEFTAPPASGKPVVEEPAAETEDSTEAEETTEADRRIERYFECKSHLSQLIAVALRACSKPSCFNQGS